MEEMDLINTVNQLLLENSKLRSDKVALEEEVKNQRRSNVLDRVKSVVSARDVALCANDKVQICSIHDFHTLPGHFKSAPPLADLLSD